MFSLKTAIRRTITMSMTVALATTVFVGCSGNTSTSTPDFSSDISISDNITPGISAGTTDTGMLFRHWYDNEDVKAKATTSEGTPTGKSIGSLPKLSILADGGGNYFFQSGMKPTYLREDGENLEIATKDWYNLMRNDEGYRVYQSDMVSTPAEIEQGFNQKVMAAGGKAYTTYEELVNEAANSNVLAADLYTVHVNNKDTGIVFDSAKLIPISEATTQLLLGSIEQIDGGVIYHMFTATDEDKIDITILAGDTEVTVRSSTGWAKTATIDEIQISTDLMGNPSLLMSADAIEYYLGYSVIPYNGFINIVTDSRDLILQDLTDTVSNLVGITLNAELNGENTHKPLPAKPVNTTTTLVVEETSEPEETKESVETPVEETKENNETQKPSTSLADTDESKPAETTKPKPAETTKPKPAETTKPKPKPDTNQGVTIEEIINTPQEKQPTDQVTDTGRFKGWAIQPDGKYKGHPIAPRGTEFAGEPIMQMPGESDSTLIKGSTVTYGEFRAEFGYDCPAWAKNVTAVSFEKPNGSRMLSPEESKRVQAEANERLHGKVFDDESYTKEQDAALDDFWASLTKD